MDKYLLVILIFCVVGIPMSFVNPANGELIVPPVIPLFYASIAGICIIIIYSSYKERQERRKANAERRRKSKR